jgi:ABC-2 type transport system ATP-binding protein
MLAGGEGRAILVSSHVLAEISQIADEVVVINHGRSVLQASLADLMAQRNGGMRVAGPDVARLLELLRVDGAQVERAADGTIVVADGTGEQIGRVIATNGIVVSELAARDESLEGSKSGDNPAGTRPLAEPPAGPADTA